MTTIRQSQPILPLDPYLGVRIKRHPKITGPVNHRLGSCRERRPSDMLHFSDHLRLKMAKSVVEYFRVIHKINDSSAKSKNEALAANSPKSESDPAQLQSNPTYIF